MVVIRLCAPLIVPTSDPLMLAQSLWHQDIQLNYPLRQLVRGCTATDDSDKMHCLQFDLNHMIVVPSSVQMHQVSRILLPLFSVLHSFSKQWFLSLSCILLISSMFSGVSLGHLHSAVGEEGEIPSIDAAGPPWTSLLGYFCFLHCCYLSLWLTCQYCHQINSTLSHLGLECFEH